MGYPRGCTRRALGRASQRQTGQLEDARCALIGVSFRAPCVAWLLGSALREHGLVEVRPDFARCWGTLVEDDAGAAARRLLDSGGSGRSLEEEAVALLHRSAMFKGSDVRLADQVILNPGIWPRRGLGPGRWNWKVVLSDPLGGSHINVLELKAVLSSIKWWTRQSAGLGRRVAHALDSQVCMSVPVKGRSSFFQLQAVLRRIDALLLASSLAAAFI